MISLEAFLPIVLACLAIVSRLDALSAYLEAELRRCTAVLLARLPPDRVRSPVFPSTLA
jgi:hypothetical protein